MKGTGGLTVGSQGSDYSGHIQERELLPCYHIAFIKPGLNSLKVVSTNGPVYKGYHSFYFILLEKPFTLH